jgi:hypothetical protein
MKRPEDVLSFIKKLTVFFFSLDTNSLLIFLSVIATIIVILGAAKESILSSQTIIITLISSIVLYIYFKKNYSKKLKILKNKNKILKRNSILDDLCADKETQNKNLCDKYRYAKHNFNKISSLLLQQYNI